MSNGEETKKKPIYKKWWFWVIIVVIIVAIATSQGTETNNVQQTSVNTDNSNATNTNDTKISLEEFNQIETGMSYEEVVEIVGGEGTVLSESDITGDGQYKTTIYSWDGNGMLGANANVTFQGGKVISKAQFGLE